MNVEYDINAEHDDEIIDNMQFHNKLNVEITEMDNYDHSKIIDKVSDDALDETEDEASEDTTEPISMQSNDINDSQQSF